MGQSSSSPATRGAFLTGNPRLHHHCIPQTPAGMLATAVRDVVANAGLDKQQPTQASDGGQLAPAPAPVCTSAGCRPRGAAVLASDHDVGPYILNTCDRADCLHFSSILCTYLKNTIVCIPYRKYALIGMTY